MTTKTQAQSQEESELGGRNPHELWVAVIENAIRDSMLTNRNVRRSAREWLLTDQEDFPYVCELAGMDDVYLRNMMTAKFRAALATATQEHEHLLRTRLHEFHVTDEAGVHTAQL